MSETSLRQIQHWMELVMVTRGDLQQKLQTAAESTHLEIDDVVASKKGVSAHRRLDIYASGYVLRLLECMKNDYPALRAFMGEEVFEVFAKAYIVSLPPESWSLYHLGRRFPQFLRDTRPAHAMEGDAGRHLLDLPAEIATLERAKTEVLQAPGAEGYPPTAIAAIAPGALEYLFDNTLFQTAPCFRLLQLEFPLLTFLNRLENGESPDVPSPKTTYVAVTRRDFRLRVWEIEPWQQAFFMACAEPISIRQGAARVAADMGLEIDKVLAQLFVWLPAAVEQGCLVRSDAVHP